MTDPYRLPDDDHLGVVEQLFDALLDIEEVIKGSGGRPVVGKLAFSRLYGYATGAKASADLELERALERDPALRADFRRLLDKTKACYLPRVAAASSGAITGREGLGCRVRFEASRAEPTQTFVMIEEFESEAPPPSLLFVCDAENRCLKFALPPARGAVIQILLEQGSELLDMLLDIENEVFLR